ncbi:MAG: hypothetical protein ACM3SV_14070, partial [Betaproteobacteria bacterium]
DKRAFEGVRRLDSQVAPPHSAAPQVLRNDSPRPLAPAATTKAEVAPVQAKTTDSRPTRRDGDLRQPEAAKPAVAVQAPHAQAPSPVVRNEPTRPPAFRPNAPMPEREAGAVSFSGKGRDERRHAPESKASAPAPAPAAVAPPKRPSLPEVIVKRPEVQVMRVPAGAPSANTGHAGEDRSGRNIGAAPRRNDKPAEAPKRREEAAKPDAKPEGAR